MSRAVIRLSIALLALAASTLPLSAQAWWNADYKQRTVVTLNTGPAGVTTSEAISGAAGSLFAQDPLSLLPEGGKAVARLGNLKITGGDLPPPAAGQPRQQLFRSDRLAAAVGAETRAAPGRSNRHRTGVWG